jgi:hypothetical protein
MQQKSLFFFLSGNIEKQKTKKTTAFMSFALFWQETAASDAVSLVDLFSFSTHFHFTQLSFFACRTNDAAVFGNCTHSEEPSKQNSTATLRLCSTCHCVHLSVEAWRIRRHENG